jgi:hypothetical protein
MNTERIEYTGPKSYRSTRAQREEVEAQFHLKRTMKALGWRCVRHTGTGKPNRFEKIIPGWQPFYVTSAPAGRWRIEQYSGYSFRVKGIEIRKMIPFITHRFETPLAMALWFDYVGRALLEIAHNGN